jgi:opacity protein-like surface antigen
VYEYAYDNDGNLDTDFCTTESESKTYSGKGTNVLRSRLQVDYNIPHCKVDPFASAELYNSWAVTKVRYSVGADWKLTKQHVFTVAYRYQDLRGDYDDEPDMHIVSVGYKFKF